MNAEIKNDEWRAKYLDSIGRLESEEQRFRAVEAILKRLAGRMCIATLGMSPRLDSEVRKLQTLLKRETTSDELESMLAPLTDAIHALDEKDHGQSTTPLKTISASYAPSEQQTLTDDAPLRAALSALLIDLRRDPELCRAADDLDGQLSSPLPASSVAPLLTTLNGMVSQRIARLEKARHEAEALLAQMVSRLDEISRFVADQNQNQQQVLVSGEALRNQVSGEMRAMGESIESSNDLQQIRSQVRNRLDTIGQHLQEFQKRETERADSMRTRNEQMQARVTQLEAEAQKLQTQLQAEQQNSMIDALTRAPNRLAYNKRMEEELQRWRRFAQPTCIAVWDIDRFKNINDSYGHRAGDRVLTIFAECLAKNLRSTDFLCRYGGEEFITILPGTSLQQATALLDAMRVAVSKLGFHFRGAPVFVTASCGVTELQQGDDADSAFERADKALYQAKNDGRNRCVSA